jgi:hypothetical protein
MSDLLRLLLVAGVTLGLSLTTIAVVNRVFGGKS